MPDATDPRDHAPRDWAEAFAALPAETPPADAWTRVAAALDARAPAVAAAPRAGRGFGRRRAVRLAGWLGVATAATLALVVAWPRPEAPAPATLASSSPSAVPATATVPTDVAPEARRTPAADAAATPPGAAAIALPAAAEASRKPRLADAGDARAVPAAAAAASPLDALYAESARLEHLLDLARDDRVASASAALLATELEAQVGAIDVRLAEPGLDDAQRTALWRARVDALRQAAGFESTQRVLASYGDAATMLVSVD